MKSADLIELTRLLLECSSKQERWPVVIAHLARLLNARKGSLVINDLERELPIFQVEYGHKADFNTQYARRFSTENPFLAKRDAFIAGRVLDMATVLPPEALHRTKYYREFLKPHGIEHILCAVLFEDSSLHGFLNLSRPADMRPFNARERDLMQRLVPALQQTILLNQTLNRQAAELDMLTELLNCSPRGIVVLNGRGEVVKLNRNALAILEGCDGLRFEGKGIRAVLPEENLRFNKLMQATLSDISEKHPAPSGSCMLVTRKEVTIPISVMFIAFRHKQPFGQDSQPRIVLIFNNLEQSASNTKAVLKKLYDFTEAEAGLAVLILRGLPIEECARRLGITLNTARTHLKKLFLKTETNRQGELMRVMLESAATLYLD